MDLTENQVLKDNCGTEEITKSSLESHFAESAEPLRDHVKRTVTEYLNDAKIDEISDTYDLMLLKIEPPLLEAVMEKASNNQSRAAKILGLNRGTLRKKLERHGMI